MDVKTNCPCGNRASYNDCCGRFIEQGKLAPTPEALMRSRYSAYTRANIDYIQATMTGSASLGFDPIDAKTWATRANWLGLRVVKTQTINPIEGMVEFIATYKDAGETRRIHEISRFKKIHERWYYINAI